MTSRPRRPARAAPAPPPSPSPGRLRVMVLSHAHPELSTGGAERASYALFERLKARPEIGEATYVARAAPDAIGHSARLGAFRGRPDEILAAPPPCDPFTHCSADYDALARLVGELVARFRPDVVHVHHFVYWGIEVFTAFARAGVRVVFTMHEFMAICHREGQMVKTNGRLCASESPAECAACFPAHTAGMFFLRKRILLTHLAAVDAFVSPSEFLARRYADWGLPAARVAAIENPLPPDAPARAERAAARARARARGRGPLTIGYFGQINPYKGVDVLLESLTLLDAETRACLSLRVHGANLELQSDAFRARIAALAEKAGESVAMLGPYDNARALDLMAECDWIAVPSVWWENSPVVIQEALALGKPLIVSAIGGMAEKAARAPALVTVAPGDAAGLARALAALPEVPEGGGGGAAAADAAVEAIVATYRARGAPR